MIWVALNEDLQAAEKGRFLRCTRRSLVRRTSKRTSPRSLACALKTTLFEQPVENRVFQQTVGLFLFMLSFAWSSWVFADKVTLDTGSTIEGVVREEGDSVYLDYISALGGHYQLKTVTIPKARVKGIERDPSYFEKVKGMTRGLGGLHVPSAAAAAPAHKDSLQEAIGRSNRELQDNLSETRQLQEHSRFYRGWHEGYHWDPANGYHRWNHDGLYDPYDPNIKARSQ